jgi:hypothetical protein
MTVKEFATLWTTTKSMLGSVPVPLILQSLSIWHDPEGAPEAWAMPLERLVCDPARWARMREDLEFLTQDPQSPVADAARALLSNLVTLRQGL